VAVTDDQRNAFLVLLDRAVELGWPFEGDEPGYEPTVTAVVRLVVTAPDGLDLAAAAGVRWQRGRLTAWPGWQWWAWSRLKVWERYMVVQSTRGKPWAKAGWAMGDEP
jgi:hypothetical protein